MTIDSVTLEERNSTENVAEGTEVEEIVPSSQVQFWTYLLFQIPSLICTIFLLYHLLFKRRFRQALHNHIIIILLFVTLVIEVLDNPLYIDAYRSRGYNNSFPLSSSICLMWWFIDFGFYGAITVLLAWGSIERHILVFHHHQFLRTQQQRFVLHYFPLTIISIYLCGFYIGVIFFPPCKNEFDFESFGSGLSPCYEQVSFLNTWDYLGNGMVCTIIETIFSMALLVRVFWQKHRIHQPMNWRRHRKMTFQFLSVSCLSLTIVFPLSLIIVIQQVGGPEMSDFGGGIEPYLLYLYTFVVFLLPFICLGCLPELWPKLLFFRQKRRRAVGAITLMLDRRQSSHIQS